MLAAGPWGRPRTDHRYGSRKTARTGDGFKRRPLYSTVVQMATPEHRRGRPDSVGWWNRPGLGVTGPRGRPRSLRRRASAGLRGRLGSKSRRSTFEYILKPEVVAIGGRRCGHHGSTAGRDENAVACRMDRAGRLWVAISVARSDAWQASACARNWHVQVNYVLTPQCWEPRRPR